MQGNKTKKIYILTNVYETRKRKEESPSEELTLSITVVSRKHNGQTRLIMSHECKQAATPKEDVRTSDSSTCITSYSSPDTMAVIYQNYMESHPKIL